MLYHQSIFPFYGWILVHWMDIPHLNYPFMSDGHLGCSQLLSTMNSAATEHFLSSTLVPTLQKLRWEHRRGNAWQQFLWQAMSSVLPPKPAYKGCLGCLAKFGRWDSFQNWLCGGVNMIEAYIITLPACLSVSVCMYVWMNEWK
jgi:hypothetical protein